MADQVLSMESITKRFPGVVALENVQFDLNRGEIHLLLGQNGAGKSTLIKILTGAHSKDSGRIFLHGTEVNIHNPHHAQQLGIAAIYQEPNLVPELSVAENIFLGREPGRFRGLYLNRTAIEWQARKWLDTLGICLDPRWRVRELGIGLRQMVEIARALSQEASILIMDEPTSALTENEIGVLFQTIRRLKQTGVSVIYISHRLREATEIGDRATVLRNGRNVGTVDMGNVSVGYLVTMMVGKALEEGLSRDHLEPGDEVLRVEHVAHAPLLRDISFSLHAGEILGIAGIMGSGRTELAQAIFGAVRRDAGSIYLFKRRVDPREPRHSISSGVAFLPEDRKLHGLILGLSIAANISLPSLRRMARFGVIDLKAERQVAAHFNDHLRIKSPNIHRQVRLLSGGNQQKVVLAKWLCTKAKVFIFDEPTRGIDVEAKAEIFSLMDELAKQGAGIILISSELSEVVGIADRVLVLRKGRIVHEFPWATATEEVILNSAIGDVGERH